MDINAFKYNCSALHGAVELTGLALFGSPHVPQWLWQSAPVSTAPLAYNACPLSKFTFLVSHHHLPHALRAAGLLQGARCPLCLKVQHPVGAVAPAKGTHISIPIAPRGRDIVRASPAPPRRLLTGREASSGPPLRPLPMPPAPCRPHAGSASPHSSLGQVPWGRAARRHQ